MTRTRKQYLKFYKDCMKTGRLPLEGLCISLQSPDYPFEDDALLNFFQPTNYELSETGWAPIYWGSGLPQSDINRVNAFTPLRQTIVLFLAEMAADKVSSL